MQKINKFNDNLNIIGPKIKYFRKQKKITQEELASKEFEASCGGGAVEVKVSGAKVLKEIKIKPEVVDPEDVEMLQDLIMTAINEALRKVDDASSDAMGKYNIPGLM